MCTKGRKTTHLCSSTCRGPVKLCDARRDRNSWPLSAASASRRLRSTFLRRTCVRAADHYSMALLCGAHVGPVASCMSQTPKTRRDTMLFGHFCLHRFYSTASDASPR